ncbi:MauE/DoxX family redox-associated membrane protein [Nafulsella turpanensis]|uniref:MauE/DoxX family redox-associated membrane protein n=1 Tax=Nafulsella turpanensis TaxID=1265690 RepID=UPI00034DEA1C|nr:MauE/DoxX family redox-associated membrane protein [Nafulsella turpanensis]
MKHPHRLLYLSLPLILLLAYTGISKLLDLKQFSQDLLSQPLPDSLHPLLVWLLPAAELGAALLLAWKPQRPFAWWPAFGLMGMFTLYTVLILSGAFAYVPCSCGGMLESLSWKEHLLVNSFFCFLSLSGLYLALHQKPPSTRP